MVKSDEFGGHRREMQKKGPLTYFAEGRGIITRSVVGLYELCTEPSESCIEASHHLQYSGQGRFLVE